MTKVLLAKLGLDGHDRGLRMIAKELSDRGAEVILLGVGTTAGMIAHIASQEDVDAVAISLLSGSHLTLIPDVVDELRRIGHPVPVVCGGTIPIADAARLQAQGVAEVAPVGTSVRQAVDAILKAANPRASQTRERPM